MYTTLKTEVTEKDFYSFLKISVPLTGFSENDLLATGMHESYYYTIMKEPDQDLVRDFFRHAQEILDDCTNDEARLLSRIREELFPDARYYGLAKRIILLWYTGIWTSVVVAEGVATETADMVSAESYIQGLIWTAAQTHPAGAKQPGFASWAEPPL